MIPRDHLLPEFARPLEIPLESLRPPLPWEALFGRPGPCALEIGTGNGWFIAAEASRLSHWNFIAVEREPEFYAKMVKRCARTGLTNVRTTDADAMDLLRGGWIAPGTLARVYCYFSDPWHKRRHRERRVVTDALPPLLEPLLAAGGEFWFKTDVGWYYNLAVTVFRERGGWIFLQNGRLPPPDPARGEVVTNFERKAREAGSEVWGFRVAPDDGVCG